MMESYIETHSLAHFTHSFCPDCAQRLYPEIFLEALIPCNASSAVHP